MLPTAEEWIKCHVTISDKTAHPTCVEEFMQQDIIQDDAERKINQNQKHPTDQPDKQTENKDTLNAILKCTNALYMKKASQ